jgi:cyclopropane-fatty-acyl-phospholipid synthase
MAPLNTFCRRVVHSQFNRLEDGIIDIRQGQERTIHGQVSAEYAPAVLQINDASVWRDLLTGGSLGAAESYVAGDWDSPDLVGLLRLFVRNVDRLNAFEDRFSWASKPALRLLHWMNRNSPTGSRKNIEAHYDLGNELFELFLDPAMMYSCAIFPNAETSLAEASRFKLDRICQKLNLGPKDRVVEIGTGWGGFAIHAARHYGCHVTTTTISRAQHDWAQARIREAGLEDRITLLLEDYRNLSGKFDKLVSIEMIEAVGPQYLPQYLGTVNRLLKAEGLALVQAITMPEQRYQRALRNVDLIQRYIFPGSFIPSFGAILESVRSDSDLILTHAEDIGFHYARTLAAWRARFNAARDAIGALGYDERFRRLWDFYFAYCEAGFSERAIGTSQLVFAQPRNKRANILNVG